MSDDWRSLPRKRVLVPGKPGPKLPPSKRRLAAIASAERRRERENLRHRRRRLAEKAFKLFDQAFAVAVLHGLQQSDRAVEAARPAPVAVDREIRGGNDVG